jgi:signal transduction histidine kinase
VPLIIDSVPQAAMVSSATVHRLGGTVRAVAVQVIQSELNAVELAAQSDLIRVLTHEIMNSMTPVTSLAHTAVQLMATAGDAEVVVDARAAVETLARRADGVMNFVESYRELSRRPQIRRRGFAVLAWARELEAVFRATDAGKGIAFSLTVEPDDLVIEADPDLLSQVLINLLRNGAEAAAGHQDDPAVSLSFTRTRGGRTQIEIADNGPGVPDELAQDVFLPFFTTKPKGSGVGLSLARQLVLAHHGSINLEVSPEGGALFRIML